MVDLSVQIGKLSLKNPVLTASGCSGFGRELAAFYNVSRLGGIVLKGITPHSREGNPYPRMAETASGMLNAVGLQNKGVDYFVSDIYPQISHYDTCLIVNINGSTVGEYVEVTRKITSLERVDAVELNISCPNVKEGGMAFGVSPQAAAKVTKAVRKACTKPLIVKLSPNVTDITAIASIAEAEGADAVSLVNTFLGMAVHAATRTPVLPTITGGLSGPAIKPIALRMVWQTARAVKIPVIGLGGILTAEDALEFLIAGAAAIQVGTALFIDPACPLHILEGIHSYLRHHQIPSVRQLSGSLQM